MEDNPKATEPRPSGSFLLSPAECEIWCACGSQYTLRVDTNETKTDCCSSCGRYARITLTVELCDDAPDTADFES
jgi:hypothetical protein